MGINDCKLVITVRDGTVRFEGVDVSMEDLARISGFLQVFVATESIKEGLSMDDVKSNMLDLHLAAMEAAEELYREGGPDGRKEEDD